MARRIKNVSDLPEWFKLDKYRAAHSLNFSGWYEQLVVRRKLAEIIGSDISPQQRKTFSRALE